MLPPTFRCVEVAAAAHLRERPLGASKLRLTRFGAALGAEKPLISSKRTLCI